MARLSRRSTLGLIAAGVTTPLAVPLAVSAANDRPLAIRGYDPVAYFADGKPERGLAGIEYEWDGQRYRFVSPEHRDLFAADPIRYAPQFANFCAMALGDGELVEANPEYWLISDGKLYLFGKPVGPHLFKQDSAGRTAKANQNRALIVNR